MASNIKHHVTDPPRYPKIIIPIETVAKNAYKATLNKMVIDINFMLKKYGKKEK